MPAGTSLLDLPDEVLETVFCLLPPRTARSCLYTCKRISQIVKVKPLHQTIVLHRPAAVHQFREHLLRHTRSKLLVKSITFACESSAAEDQFSLAMQAPTLEMLPNITYFSSAPLSKSVEWQALLLRKLMRYSCRIKHLNLTKCELPGVEAVWDYGTVLSVAGGLWLKSLQIAGESSGTFRNQGRSFRWLQELAIIDRQFDGEEVTTLLDAIPDSLVSLKFSNCNGLPLNLFAVIADKFGSLTILYLLNNNRSLAGEALANVEGRLANFHSLRNLAVSRGVVDPEDLVELDTPLARVVLDHIYGLTSAALGRLLAKWQIAKGEFDITVNNSYTSQEKLELQVRTY